MSNVNKIAPASNQIWERIKSGEQIIIADIDGGVAYCNLMNGTKVGTLRVAVPFAKLMDWGNRGMRHVRTRKGKAPKVLDYEAYGEFSFRKPNMGAE